MDFPENFIKANLFTQKWEGGLSDHPADRGGLTKYGVSIELLKDKAATKSGRDFLSSIGVKTPVTKDTIRGLTKEQATAIFYHFCWQAVGCDGLPPRLAAILYDMTVNHGPKWGVKLCQRGVNAAAGRGTLVEDGIMGPKTRAALQKDSLELALAIIEKRRAYYRAIVASKPAQKVFLKGWLNRADDLEKWARGLA